MIHQYNRLLFIIILLWQMCKWCWREER